MSDPIESPTRNASDVGFASALRAGVEAGGDVEPMSPERYHAGNHDPVPFAECWRCQRARAICRSKRTYGTREAADGAVREVNEAASMSSDLPVARVRAQVVQEILDDLKPEIDWQHEHYGAGTDKIGTGRLIGMQAAYRTVAKHRAQPAKSVVAAPDPAELWNLLDGPKPGFCCQDAYASDGKPETLHTSGCPNRCSNWVPTQRGPVERYPCGLTVGHDGDCWLHPAYRAAAPRDEITDAEFDEFKAAFRSARGPAVVLPEE